MDSQVIDRGRIEHASDLFDDSSPEEDRYRTNIAIEALIAWADEAQEELYELKALVEQRGWRKGQAEQLAALIAQWPGKDTP